MMKTWKKLAQICILPVMAIACCSCAQEDPRMQQSEAILRNMLAVDSWINTYKLHRSVEASAAFPRLIDLKYFLMERKKIPSLEVSPLTNPVTKKREWPRESPHKIKEFRSLLEDNRSVIGPGSIEFIPIIEDKDGEVSGYILRAGDPVTGQVLCVNGEPFVKSSP